MSLLRKEKTRALMKQTIQSHTVAWKTHGIAVVQTYISICALSFTLESSSQTLTCSLISWKAHEPESW